MHDDTFLSNLRTGKLQQNKKVTNSLATSVRNAFLKVCINIIILFVIYNNKYKTITSDFQYGLKTNYHEEADTAIVLQGIDVAREDPFWELTHFRPMFHLCKNQVVGFY